MGPTSLIILIPLLLATTILPAQAAARSSDRCEGMLIDRDQLVVGDSFVAPLVEIFGDVYIGGRSFVAGNTIVSAAPDRLVCVGSETTYKTTSLCARSVSQLTSGIKRAWRTTASCAIPRLATSCSPRRMVCCYTHPRD